MDFSILSIMIGGIAGGLAVLAVGLLLPRRSCPNCRALLPRFRKPGSITEALLGGWHCRNCQTKVSRSGKVLPECRRADR